MLKIDCLELLNKTDKIVVELHGFFVDKETSNQNHAFAMDCRGDEDCMDDGGDGNTSGDC